MTTADQLMTAIDKYVDATIDMRTMRDARHGFQPKRIEEYQERRSNLLIILHQILR
jgi:hypothetical protein